MTTQLTTNEMLTSITLVDGTVYSIEGKKFVSRKPKGFRGGFNDELACPHRDCSVCDECANTYANIVDVFCRGYWVRDYDEWLETVQGFAVSALEAQVEREAREERGFSCFQMYVEDEGWTMYHVGCYESAGFTDGTGMWYATGLETCGACHTEIVRDNMGDL